MILIVGVGLTTLEIVIIILLLLILFYPKVIVDFARGLGQITREFKKNDKDDSRKDEEPIIKLARELGIDIRRKSHREILEEVREKIKNYLDRQHIEYVG